MRRLAMLAIVGSVLLVAVAGVAWAANITCPGGHCVGTEENDRITGSLLDDQIGALGGRDHVSARPGDDQVRGYAGGDEITGGVGADFLFGDMGPDEIGGGPGTPEGNPIGTFTCPVGEASTSGAQFLSGGDGNDSLTAGRDNDLLQGDAGRNTLSGNGGGDCLILTGDENERASGGDGDDIIIADDSVFGVDSNGDDVFCGAGIDAVVADAEDRVAADCEDEIPQTPLQAGGSTPEAGVTITAPEDIDS